MALTQLSVRYQPLRVSVLPQDPAIRTEGDAQAAASTQTTGEAERRQPQAEPDCQAPDQTQAETAGQAQDGDPAQAEGTRHPTQLGAEGCPPAAPTDT